MPLIGCSGVAGRRRGMPYIPHERRGRAPKTPGELNHAITCIVLDHLGPDPCYADYNAALGVLAVMQSGLSEVTPVFNIEPGEAMGISRRVRGVIQKYRGVDGFTWYDVVGVLVAVQHELYRRHVAPYEDKAIKRNGDVLYDKETRRYR